MLKRVIAALGTSVAICAGVAAVAGASAGPLTALPKAANGKKVSIVATGLTLPTSFAFGAGRVFVADNGTETGNTGGGVYVLKNHTATRLPGSPPFAFGLVWRKGTLYVSFANKILAWSHWTGTKFAAQKTLVTEPKGFSGFNGLAFGPDGRLYAGVDVGVGNDHGPASKKTPYLYDVLSFTAAGKHQKVVATGIRQPWQIAFAKGDPKPFVTVLGQDAPPTVKASDYLLHIGQGDAYGFPQCNRLSAKLCQGFTKPFQLFAPHSDIGGIGVIGQRIFLSEFGFAGAPAVVTVPVGGGTPKTFLSGFASGTFTIGLGTNNGWVYVGATTMAPGGATVYRVHS